MNTVYFITHPQVVIDPAVPIQDWTLSPVGLARIRGILGLPWMRHLGSVWCSTERKAIEGAATLAGVNGTLPRLLTALGENDRSATGYLPKAEFEATADAFFAQPHNSIRGWETAVDAQRRIVGALSVVLSETPAGQDIAIVSHGGVGTLLLCHLKGCAISRSEDQPGDGGGNYYCFGRATHSLRHGWQPIEDLTR